MAACPNDFLRLLYHCQCYMKKVMTISLLLFQMRRRQLCCDKKNWQTVNGILDGSSKSTIPAKRHRGQKTILSAKIFGR